MSFVVSGFKRRIKGKTVTTYLSGAMMLRVGRCFPTAWFVNDRFHVQQLFNEAMDELRIEIRHRARQQEADLQEMCKERGVDFVPLKYRNGETLPQILLRTKQALMVSQDRWKPQQKTRMEILFENFPVMKQAYGVMQKLRWIFNQKVNLLKGGHC